jgi:hypothetical protein
VAHGAMLAAAQGQSVLGLFTLHAEQGNLQRTGLSPRCWLTRQN